VANSANNEKYFHLISLWLADATLKNKPCLKYRNCKVAEIQGISPHDHENYSVDNLWDIMFSMFAIGSHFKRDYMSYF